MDSDGDGLISLHEFRATYERIFKAMDADKDGTLTLEEMQVFQRRTVNFSMSSGANMKIISASRRKAS